MLISVMKLPKLEYYSCIYTGMWSFTLPIIFFLRSEYLIWENFVVEK